MKILRLVVTEECADLRIDKALSLLNPDHTRNYFQNLIEKGKVSLNNKIVRSSVKVRLGDKIEIQFPDLQELALKAMDIPLTIVYEDPNVLVIDKPPGLVVHPGTHGSHSDDSLVNAILHYCKGSLGGINGTLRPGIVHRLDKDTSGLLVVAKNDIAQQFLMDQFVKKEVVKVYYALVVGRLEPQKGTIDAPIGRSLQDRKKMAVIQGKTSKDAITKYEVVTYLDGYTFVKVYLLTGRTHQIRVHFAAIGHPLVGDTTYGRLKINNWFEQHYGLRRQFLHAAQLSFFLPGVAESAVSTVALKNASAKERKAGNIAPQKQKRGEFSSPLPPDLQVVLDNLTPVRPSLL